MAAKRKPSSEGFSPSYSETSFKPFTQCPSSLTSQYSFTSKRAESARSFDHANALGNPRAIGETFNIAAPSAFSYDVLSEYISKKLNLPVVNFALDGFHDFSIDINKARSVLGYRPEYDVFRIADNAMAFRQSGKTRSISKYVG